MTPFLSFTRFAFVSSAAFVLALSAACGDDTNGSGGTGGHASVGGSTSSEAATNTTGVSTQNSSASSGQTSTSSSTSETTSVTTGAGGAPPDTSNPAHVTLAGGNWLVVGGVTVFGDVAAMTSDELGNLFVAGSFCGNLDWDTTTLTGDCTNGSEYVLALDASGNELWSRTTPVTAVIEALRVDGAGHLVLAGKFNGPTDFGAGATLDSFGAFVAALDATDGTATMAAPVVGSDLYDAVALAIDPISTDLFVAGSSGGNTLLARLNAMGQTLWTKVAGDSQQQSLTDVAVSDDGVIAIAGRYDGTIDLGSGSLPYNDPNIGSAWGFVALVDGLGAPIAVHTLQASVNIVPSGKLAFDAGDNLYWTGTYSEAAAGDIVLAHDNAYGPAAYVVKLDPTGAVAWAQGFSGPTFESPSGGPVTVDAAGHILATGSFLNSMPGCGTGLSVPLSHSGAYLMALEADGSCTSLTLLADATDSITPFAIAPLPGRAAVAGSFKLDTKLGGTVYETQQAQFSAYARPFIITATP